MNENFLLQISAYLDSKGIKTDYEKLKKLINADPMMAKLGIDSSASKQQVRDLAVEIHKSLDGIFKNAGVEDFKISVKDVESIINGSLRQAQKQRIEDEKQIAREAEKTKKIYDDFNKKNMSAIDLEIKQREENSKIQSNQIKAQMLERIEAENKIQSEIKETAKEQQDASNLQSNKVVLNNNISTYLRQNSKLTSDFKNKLIELQQQLKSADKTQLNNLKNEFKEIKTEASAIGASGKSSFDELKSNMKSFATFIFGGGILMSGLNTIREMVSNVVELDQQLVELSKVSELSAEGLKKVTDQAYELGATVGKTGTDALATITDFVRAGYDLQDALDLSKQALMMVNVSENITDASVAAEDLIHIMNGLGVGAEYAQTINDAINEVDILAS